MNQNSFSAIIPQRIWDAYSKMRPNEEIPIHPGDHFRLKAGGPLYEVSEILSAPAAHAVELIESHKCPTLQSLHIAHSECISMECWALL